MPLLKFLGRPKPDRNFVKWERNIKRTRMKNLVIVVIFSSLFFSGFGYPIPISILENSPTISRIANITQAEYNALISFFFSTNGPEWTNHSNWLDQSISHC